MERHRDRQPFAFERREARRHEAGQQPRERDPPAVLEGEDELARRLVVERAGLVAARLPPLEGEWLAVPVPLHRRRLWQRGFNQSALLAIELSKRSGAGVLVDGLVRRKPTPTLGGLGRKARARALVGAIAVNPRRAPELKGAQVLLVDDVMTSGATSDACVSALKRAGAERVVVACFARVLDEALDDAGSWAA